VGTIHHYYYRTTQTLRQDMVLAGDCVNAIAGLAAQAVAQTGWLGERSTPIIPRLQTAIRGCRVSLASDPLALSGRCSSRCCRNRLVVPKRMVLRRKSAPAASLCELGTRRWITINFSPNSASRKLQCTRHAAHARFDHPHHHTAANFSVSDTVQCRLKEFAQSSIGDSYKAEKGNSGFVRTFLFWGFRAGTVLRRI
jgi:hypothetical protein